MVLLVEYYCFREGHEFIEFRETELKGTSKHVSGPKLGVKSDIKSKISQFSQGIVVRDSKASVDC